jgi:hypothetical protein
MARLFTLEEANALVPRLREILADLRQAFEALEGAEGEVAGLRWRTRGNGHNLPDGPFARRQAARATVQQQLGRVQELGCELKDPRLGLVDFPSRFEGREVYLCWKMDEPEVAYWHPQDEGFASRKPL